MRFIDTNVLLYSLSTLPSEALKAGMARDVLQVRHLALSVQVLQEFYVQATRPSRPDPLTYDEAVAFISAGRRFQVKDITLSVMDRALVIRKRCQLSCWDSAIIAVGTVFDAFHREDILLPGFSGFIG